MWFRSSLQMSKDYNLPIQQIFMKELLCAGFFFKFGFEIMVIKQLHITSAVLLKPSYAKS